MKWLVYAVLVIGSISCLLGCEDAELKKLKHTVSFNHQGNKSSKPIQASLFERNSALGQRDFHMDVNSVFCGEDVCKLDKVRIFWNELGLYQKFELAENIRLEKGNAEDFSEQDYQKLDDILGNALSGLADLYPAELVNQNRGGNVVDALSGATVSIHNADTVKGAIWTCYTLWHYANGELQQVIRDIAGKHYSLLQLAELLTHSDISYQLFAIEQLRRRAFFDDKTLAQILDRDLVNHAELHPSIIEYVEALSKHQYVAAVLRLLRQTDTELAIATVESIHIHKPDSSLELSMALANSLAASDSFQLSNSILTIISSYSVLPEEVLIKLTSILEDQSFIKARGVYWILTDYPLPNKERNDLQLFYQKNSERL